MDITYDSIYRLCDEFFSSELKLGELTASLKVLAIAFFLLNVYTNMFSRMGTTLGETKLPFDEKKLLSSLLIVLLIAFYDKLLDFLDSILMNLDQVYSRFSPIDFVPPLDEITESDIAEGAFSAMKEAAMEFMNIARDPGHLLVLFIESVGWMLDMAIYAVFLLERFFFIGLLKLLGPIAIVMAVFEKFREMFYKWLKLYIAVYLLILPFFLIIGFAAWVFEFFDSSLKMNTAADFLVGSKIRSMILIILIWLKLRLFKRSYDMVYKLFA